MERYPERFEEILVTHGIEWCNFDKKRLYYYCDGHFVPDHEFVPDYEIVGIAIEETLKDETICLPDYIDGIWYINAWSSKEDRFVEVTSEDFCKCVDKAIREVYK